MLSYRTFSDYLSSIFQGKIRKIAVNAALGCPNIDGTSGRGGCTYCSNSSFSPGYARGEIRKQIEAGKKFSENKGRTDGYLAYFQSFTGTYGPTARLIELYEEALGCPGVAGLVIATRPDCIADDLLDYFRRRFGKDAPEGHPFLLVELGVESTCNKTLSRINRGHTWECSQRAILRLNEAGIDVGAHLIIGFPGEKEDEYIRHAKLLSELPIKTLKLHQLQIIKGTAMAREYQQHPEEFSLMTPEKYAQTVLKMLDHIRSDIALDRFVSESPKGMVVAPSWGLKPSEFANLLEELESKRERYDVLLFGTMGNLGHIAASSLRKHGLSVALAPFPQNTYRDRPGYERELFKAVRKFSPRVIIPVGHTLAMAQLAGKMSAGVVAAVGSAEHIKLLDSKIEVYALAQSLGIPQPRIFTSVDQITHYPVIFKREKSFGGSGVYKPFSREALENLIAHEKGKRFLIEEYIEGTDYSVDCIIEGNDFVFSCYRCICSNQGQGPSAARECVPFPLLGEYSRRILGHIGYRGVCGLDFRVSTDGIAYFLECNPRLCGGLQTQIEAGFDIPWIMYQKYLIK